MIYHDQHVHTHYSEDSDELLENYLKIAQEKKLSYFAMSEHIDIDLCGRGENWLADYKKEAKELKLLQKKYKDITMLQGIEIGFNRNEVKRLNEIINSHDFDFINLSVHCIEDIDVYMVNDVTRYGVMRAMNNYFDESIYALSTFDNFDVWCHFDFAFKTGKLIDTSLSIKMFEEKLKKIFSLIIEKDKVLEINTKVQETLNDDEHVLYFLKLYKDLGGKNLSISSDAHKAERYMSSFDKMFSLVKKAGFDELCYFVKRKRYLYKI